ncbi:MAG: aspartate kinase [Deltaproteobacteria bacterium]|nr:aspartate kinase [Deltaproteobacteria bacterium]
MAVIVQKYGGSSVADIDKIRKVAGMVAAVRREGYDMAVVVSAMGKTTDELLAMARSISPTPKKRELDMLFSTGERITMALLAMALEEQGVESISLTGSQCGIITNARHTDARVIEVRPFRVQDEMARGKVVIVGGFQGVSYKRDVTTLGRGGSDTTATALAAALGAERCEVYSDVDGVYTADPSAVEDARHLPQISYQEMQEMSRAGAKVLAAQAVEFAKNAGIAIYTRSAFEPGRETVVRTMPPGTPRGVRAVVSERDVIRVRVRGACAAGRFAELLAIFEEARVPVKELSATTLEEEISWSRASFVISRTNLHNWPTVLEMLRERAGDEVEIDDGLAAVSLIGEGINNDNSTLIATLNLLGDRGVAVLGVATTSFRISCLVQESGIDEVVRACHERWIEQQVP